MARRNEGKFGKLMGIYIISNVSMEKYSQIIVINYLMSQFFFQNMNLK